MMKPLDDQALDALLAKAATPVPPAFAGTVMQRWQRIQAGQALGDESQALAALEAWMASPVQAGAGVRAMAVPLGLRGWLRAAVMAGGGVLAFSELLALVFGLWQAGLAL